MPLRPHARAAVRRRGAPVPAVPLLARAAVPFVALAVGSTACAGTYAFEELRTLTPVEQILGGARTYTFEATGLGIVDGTGFLCVTAGFQAIQNGAQIGIEISHGGVTATVLATTSLEIVGNGAAGPFHLQDGTDPFSTFGAPIAPSGEVAGYAVRNYTSETSLRAAFAGMSANGTWTITVRNASAAKFANLSSIGLVIDARAVPAPAGFALLGLPFAVRTRRRRDQPAARSRTTR